MGRTQVGNPIMRSKQVYLSWPVSMVMLNSIGTLYAVLLHILQVQSTDKNFMVPVGGAIVAGPSSALVDKVRSLSEVSS